MVLSFIALAVSIITWLYVIASGKYETSSLNGFQAFGYVIYSTSALVLSFALKGLTYIVKASVHYLDKEGEFDKIVDDKVNVSVSECINKLQY